MLNSSPAQLEPHISIFDEALQIAKISAARGIFHDAPLYGPVGTIEETAKRLAEAESVLDVVADVNSAVAMPDYAAAGRACAAAYRCASDPDRSESTHWAAQAAVLAAAACDGAANNHRGASSAYLAARKDLTSLQRLSQSNPGWNDDALVDPDSLGPVWPAAQQPAWWPEKRTSLLTAADLMKLSRWARVALAIRSARRVQPLYAKFSSGIPEQQVDAIEQALTFATSSACAGTPDSDRKELIDPSAAHDLTSQYVAYAAAHAAAATDAGPGVSSDPKADAAKAETYVGDVELAIQYASRAANRASAGLAFLSAFWSDYETLLARFPVAPPQKSVFGKPRRRPDSTPVNPDSLGPLWPPGEEPDWWPKASATSKERLPDDLAKSPRWALVAYAVRCAQRVHPLVRQFVVEETTKWFDVIGKEIAAAAEAARRGDPQAAVVPESQTSELLGASASSFDIKRAAAAAVNAAQSQQLGDTILHATYAASMAANAAEAAGSRSAFTKAAWHDYNSILAVATDAAAFGRPFDPDSLGPLWLPGMEPEWWQKATPLTTVGPPRLAVVWDAEAISEDHYKRLLAALGNVIRAGGGIGLATINSQDYGAPVELEVYA